MFQFMMDLARKSKFSHQNGKQLQRLKRLTDSVPFLIVRILPRISSDHDQNHVKKKPKKR